MVEESRPSEARARGRRGPIDRALGGQRARRSPHPRASLRSSGRFVGPQKSVWERELSSGQRLGSLLMTRLMTLSWRFLLILALERARSIKLRGETYGYEYHEDEE